MPVIGLVQVGSQAMADRYTYLPLIGPFIMVAWGIPDLIRGWRRRRFLLALAAISVLVMLMFCTRQQLGYWKNDIILFDHAVQVTENNYLAYANVGNALVEVGRIDAAISHYTRALGDKYCGADAHNNLGVLLMNQGQYDEAIAHFAEALLANHDYHEAQFYWGTELVHKGETDSAIAHFNEALRLRPRYADAHNNLGFLLAKQGRFEEAIAHFSEALIIRPDFALARRNLQEALSKKNEAISLLRKGLVRNRGARLNSSICTQLRRDPYATTTPMRPRDPYATTTPMRPLNLGAWIRND